ncbi:ATP-dependent acyl-CoA ligase [Sphingopyxis lindanitolerans]|uniref:ATP-dependent acyl-CoA ligase n=1 Tax=Sphingopyxis lindanitolerans TaxID=2054227 RepID=A0A2S8B3R5_9SPHN|nr:AMP-binding protein [Sphingopyxis lindanitolerans]PQM26993.1 ATP-dependent acyl-CoA ligase [Sphingopyxis lindanitolerans]
MSNAGPFHEFTGRDLPWLVDWQASLRPDKIFLVWEPVDGAPQSWTYAAFAEETRAYAAGLAAQGITAEDTVVIHMGNCPEFLFAWHACARIGALVVTTNTGSSVDELGFFLEHSRAVAVLTEPRFLPVVRDAGAVLRWIACMEGADEQDAGDYRLLPFSALRGDDAVAPRRDAEPLRLGSVQYTSGTTSRPKGVVWTHANALWSGRTTAAHLGLTAEDITLIHLPLFHTNGLGYSHMSTLWSGGTIVLTPGFSASRFWDIAIRNCCTWVSQIGFTLNALISQPCPAEHSVRFFSSGSGGTICQDNWGISQISWYGSTETVSQNCHSDWRLPEAPGSMGRAAHEYELSIRDEADREVSFGERGRLWVRGLRGLSLFAGYLHDPAATDAAFDADGFYDTGDEVTPRADGEIFYASRAKDMLKVGGENVAALEIETVIMGVAGVREVAVVGKPHPLYQEVPVAFVVAHSNDAGLAAAIEAHCADKLSKFKRPWEVRVIDELPKGLLSKVLKKKLRVMAASES